MKGVRGGCRACRSVRGSTLAVCLFSTVWPCAPSASISAASRAIRDFAVPTLRFTGAQAVRRRSHGSFGKTGSGPDGPGWRRGFRLAGPPTPPCGAARRWRSAAGLERGCRACAAAARSRFLSAAAERSRIGVWLREQRRSDSRSAPPARGRGRQRVRRGCRPTPRRSRARSRAPQRGGRHRAAARGAGGPGAGQG